MTNPNYVLVTRPRKQNDPTSYTYLWGEQVVSLAYQLGYTVIDIKADECNYETVSQYLYHYKPKLYVHVGHGCVSNLMGQKECIITEGMNGVEEDQNCKTVCDHYNNTNLLNGTIVYTIACYSSAELARVAVSNGCLCYSGYDDVLLFPVDNMNSQNMFRDTHLTFLKHLLSGDSVYEAERKMSQFEDMLIKKYKSIKYCSLPLIWNKLHRKIIGDGSARIWG